MKKTQDCRSYQLVTVDGVVRIKPAPLPYDRDESVIHVSGGSSNAALVDHALADRLQLLPRDFQLTVGRYRDALKDSKKTQASPGSSDSEEDPEMKALLERNRKASVDLNKGSPDHDKKQDELFRKRVNQRIEDSRQVIQTCRKFLNGDSNFKASLDALVKADTDLEKQITVEKQPGTSDQNGFDLKGQK